jgi:Cd2+/Zn2+-exporting ATPase
MSDSFTPTNPRLITITITITITIITITTCCEAEHGTAHSCCSASGGAGAGATERNATAGARLSSFRIEAMDCPTEQTLIQNKLGKLAGVQQLEFNLINRVLGVTHDLPNTAPIIEAINPGHAGRAAGGGRRSPGPGASKSTGGRWRCPAWALAAEVVHFTNAAPTWVVAIIALVSILSGGLTTYKRAGSP